LLFQFFSALFSLLPEAQHYFLQQGYPPDKAVYATVGFFLIGVLGLQVVSELLHRCLPSSIVSCENHDKDPSNPGDTNGCATEEGLSIRAFKPPGSPDIEERTPLLQSRTSLQYAASFLPTKRCANGKCYGYSDHPCDQQCKARLGKKNTEVDFNHGCPSTVRTSSVRHTSFTPDQTASHCVQNRHEHDEHPPTTEAGSGHHHVAKNKFLSIGVQTSIAIALHKFPEVNVIITHFILGRPPT
jgi:ZIP family zinc transporter